MHGVAILKLQQGVVTLSQIERNWPTAANAETWDFNDLTCSSIAEIRLVSLNVTTPRRHYRKVAGTIRIFNL